MKMKRIRLVWAKIKFYWKHKVNLWKFRNTKFNNPLNKGEFRNLKCPCGSGKKVKACHGIKSSFGVKEFIQTGELMAYHAAQMEVLQKHIG